MAKLTIIVGIAGSGKSALCKEIAENRNIKAFGDGTLTNSDRRRAGFDCLGELVARLLGRDEDCVMDESHLCMPTFRDTLRSFCNEFLNGVGQEWIFFDRDVLGCINNVYHDMYVQVKKREFLSRLRALVGQSGAYAVPTPGEIPGYQSPQPVYRQKTPRFTDEQEALGWVHGEIARLAIEDCGR